MKKTTYNYINMVMFLISWTVFLCLGSQSLMYNDEMMNMLELRMPLGKMIHFLFTEDAHIPAYHILLKIWQFVFGDSVFAARCFSYAGLLACAFGAGRMVKHLYGAKAGLWYTALFLFLSGYFFLYAITIRMYSWACFFCTAAFLSSEKVLKKGKTKHYVLYTVFACLGAWTHYYATVVCALIALSFLWRSWRKDRAVFKKSFVCNAVLLLSVCPLIYHVFHRPEMSVGAGWISKRFVMEAWQWFFCENNHESFVERPKMLKIETITMCCLWFAGFRFLLKGRNSPEKSVSQTGLFIALGMLGGAIILSMLFRPVLVSRYLAIPFGCLCVFFVFGIIEDRRNEILLGVLMFFSFFPPVLEIRERVKNAVQTDFYQVVKENVTPDDVIMTANFRLTYFLYYYFPDYDVRELLPNGSFLEKMHPIDVREVPELLKTKRVFTTTPTNDKIDATEYFNTFDSYMETPLILKRINKVNMTFD